MAKGLTDLARDLDALLAGMDRAMTDAGLQVARIVEAQAVQRSSGTATPSQMRAADHPFATRHGGALWDRSTINVGSGDFRRRWLIEPDPQPGGWVMYVVRNDSKVAEWLEHGTPTMFSRPLKEILVRTGQDAWNRVAPPLFEAALRNVFEQ